MEWDNNNLSKFKFMCTDCHTYVNCYTLRCPNCVAYYYSYYGSNSNGSTDYEIIIIKDRKHKEIKLLSVLKW